MLTTLLSWPFLLAGAYAALVALLTWTIHRRVKAVEERSVLVGKRVTAIRANLGEIRDSYGDGTVKIPALQRDLEELAGRVVEIRDQTEALSNRVRILPAQMARAARGERYDRDDDDDDDLGAAADGVSPEQVAELIRSRANGAPAPAAPQVESLEQRVFRLTHGGR